MPVLAMLQVLKLGVGFTYLNKIQPLIPMQVIPNAILQQSGHNIE